MRNKGARATFFDISVFSRALRFFIFRGFFFAKKPRF